MNRRIRFRPSSRQEIARRAREESRRSEEETRQSIETAIRELGRYTFQNEQTYPQLLPERRQEPVYEIGTTLPSDHPLVEARERMEQGRPRREYPLGFLPGQITEMYGYTGYGRSMYGQAPRNEGERVDREQPYLRMDTEGVSMRGVTGTQNTTFYNPKFYEVDPDNVKNTMDMIKVFRAMLGKITLDEETVKKYGLEAYVKEK